MVPSSLAVALREFPASRVSMAVAVWGGLAAIYGSSAAPISAGIIEIGGWRWMFVALVPAGLVVFAASQRLLHEASAADKAARRGDGAPLDVIGAPMGALSVGLVVAVLLKGSAWGWTSIAVLSLLACLLYTSPSPRDATLSRMPSSA